MSSEPSTLDWNLATDSASFQIINNIMGGLTKLDHNFQIKNNFAKKWYFEDGNKLYFELKKNIYWSDGIELNSKHFIDSWQRLLEPSTAADYAYFLFDIKNAKEFNSGVIKDFNKVGVKSIDKYTIEITLRNNKAYFPSLMSFMSTFPIRLDLIDKYGVKWTDPKNMVSIGPYNLIERKNNSYILLKPKNKISHPVKIIINENSSSALAMFENGEVDIIDGSGIPLLEIPRLKNKGILNVKKQYRNNYIGFNVDLPPFNNSNIRRAFSLAINKSVFKKVLHGTVSPTNSWIPEGMVGYDEYKEEYNPTLAKKIINDENFEKGTKIKFLYPHSGNNRIIAEILQNMWKENLGIDVEIKGLEWKVYLMQLDSNRPNIFRAGWAADYPDPHNFMNLFTCNSGNNETGWCNNYYDELINKGSEVVEEASRKQIYKKAQKILIEEDSVIVPLFESNQLFLKNNRIGEFEYSKLGIIDFSNLTLKN